MRFLALLLALLPHHKPVRLATENVSTITVIGAQDATAQDRQGCEVSPEVGFVWAGNDGMVGISRESCEAAFQDWRHSPPPSAARYLGLA